MREFDQAGPQADQGAQPARPTTLQLSALAGNAAMTRALTVSRESLPGGISTAPYTSFAEIKAELEVGTWDWSRLFGFANGRSMPDMLALWRELWVHDVLDDAQRMVSAQTGVDVPRMRVAIMAVQRNGRGSRVMFELEHEAELAALEPRAANQVLNEIEPENAAVAWLREAPGFQALSAEDKRKVLVFAGGSTSMSTGGEEAYLKALQDSNGAADSQLLLDILHSHPGAAAGDLVAHLPGDNVTIKQDPPVAVTGHPFQSGAANGIMTRLHIEDPTTADAANHNQIDIVEPVTTRPSLGHLPSINEVVSVIRRLPPVTRGVILQVNINPALNPADAEWAKNKDYSKDGTFRSYMTAGAEGVVDIYPSKGVVPTTELLGSLVHESGHTVSQRLWGTSDQEAGKLPKNPKWQGWVEAMRADGFRSSEYARSSVDEDFAEAWVEYTTTLGTPRHAEVQVLMPARCRIFDKIVEEHGK